MLRLVQLLLNINSAKKYLGGLFAWFVFRKKEKERRRRSEEHEYLLVLVFSILTEPISVKFLIISTSENRDTVSSQNLSGPTLKMASDWLSLLLKLL